MSSAPTISVAQENRFSRVLSVGAYRPERVVDNAQVCTLIDSSDEWIRERSGIITRHYAAPEQSVTDMAEQASQIAIKRAGIAADRIGAIIVATVSHPHQTPSAASLLGHRLGASNAAAFDISVACAGFCHGLAVADSLVRAGTCDYVLVVGVEKLTDFLDLTDRSTAFLFADGAGAVVVGPSEVPGIGPTVWGSDGAQWDAIKISSWIDVRAQDRDWVYLSMDGPAVFRWAVWQMSPVAQKALDAAGITGADLNAFIPHQANLRIVDAMVKQLKLPDSVAVARDITRSGNTSAASVPLAMDAMLESGEASSGGLALLIGFGAGLAYASQVITLP